MAMATIYIMDIHYLVLLQDFTMVLIFCNISSLAECYLVHASGLFLIYLFICQFGHHVTSTTRIENPVTFFCSKYTATNRNGSYSVEFF